jgi:hypothetical protein
VRKGKGNNQLREESKHFESELEESKTYQMFGANLTQDQYNKKFSNVFSYNNVDQNDKVKSQSKSKNRDKKKIELSVYYLGKHQIV